MNVDRMKLTTVERKLEIALVALRQIANPEMATYFKVVDRQIARAKKALKDIEHVDKGEVAEGTEKVEG